MRKTSLLVVAFSLIHCSPRPAPAQTRAADPAGLTVTAPAQATLLAEGAPAPAFRAVAHDGRVFDVSAAPRPRALVVYFYPRDETPGCIIEAEAFRDAREVYESAGADVLGVSTDTAEAHRGFAQNHALPFALVADPQGRLAGAFGVPVAGGFARRMTFVIDRQGRVARVFPQVNPRGHAQEVLAALAALPR